MTGLNIQAPWESFNRWLENRRDANLSPSIEVYRRSIGTDRNSGEKWSI